MRTDPSKRVIAAAIVKNEPKFGETLASLRAAMGDALAGVVVHDTGNDRPFETEDGLWLAHACGVRVHLAERPFDDFSSARNACLDHAERAAGAYGATWIHMFSAGAEFSGSWAPPDTFAQALHHTERLGESVYSKVTTIRIGSGLRYSGRTHETLDVAAESVPHCGLTVDYSKDWDIEKKRRRWNLDIALLADDYSPRGRFYLAQSFKCLGIYNEAFAYYMMRLDMQGFELERLQAVCDAIVTAPTLRLARYVADLGADCADVQLALAEREIRERRKDTAKQRAIDALTSSKRSLFANIRLRERAIEIIKECSE